MSTFMPSPVWMGSVVIPGDLPKSEAELQEAFRLATLPAVYQPSSAPPQGSAPSSPPS